MEILEVTQPGPHSTIQDGGRFGFRSFAIPQSGCLDPQLQSVANYLAGRPHGDPVIEIIGGRFSAKCLTPVAVGVAGVDMRCLVNEERVEPLQSLSLNKGDELVIESRLAYLAVGGSLEDIVHFGSFSTYLLAKLGRRLLKRRNRISVKSTVPVERKVTMDVLPSIQHPMVIRMLKGPEWEGVKIPAADFEHLQWRISVQSNRIGIRLNGEAVPMSFEEMVSVPTFPGTVQLPPDGQPIVLMNDGQTTGGYPRIGQVIKADLPRLARVMVGGTIRFKFVSIDEARYIHQHQQAFLLLGMGESTEREI